MANPPIIWNGNFAKLLAPAKASAYISNSANPASAGVFRMANGDAIAIRNSGNSGDLLLSAGSSDSIPQYNGIDLTNLSTAQTLTNKSLSGASNTFSSIPDGALSDVYALLSGRSGGQVLNGGSGASENLTFSSTSNATKGVIQIVDGSTFLVDPNNLVGPALAKETLSGSLIGTNSANGSFTAIGIMSDTGVGAQFTTGASEGTFASPTPLLNTEPVYQHMMFSYSGPGDWNNGLQEAARIEVLASENHTTSATGTEMRFAVTPNGTNGNQLAFIIKNDLSAEVTGGLKIATLTSNSVVETDGSKNLVSSLVTSTELGYLSGVTSSVQTQLDGMLKLAGRSGGQVAFGGTSNSENLTLNSTSSSTKGRVQLTDGSRFLLDNPNESIASVFGSFSNDPNWMSIPAFNGQTGLSIFGAGVNNGGNTLATYVCRGDVSGPQQLNSDELSFAYNGLVYDGGGAYNSQTSNFLMLVLADENHSATALGSRLEFWTTPNGTTSRTKTLTIGSDGTISANRGSLSSSNVYLSGFAELQEIATPANPPAGNQILYINSTDHKLHRLDSTGTDTVIG